MLPIRADHLAPRLQQQRLPAPRPAHLSLVPPLQGGRPPGGPPPEAPLPDWLDLLLCIAAPCLVALVVLGAFRLVAVLAASL